MRDTKETILLTVDDLVSKFMYYDRKEDDELPRGAIERAIADGIITLDEIVARFRDGLTAVDVDVRTVLADVGRWLEMRDD